MGYLANDESKNISISVFSDLTQLMYLDLSYVTSSVQLSDFVHLTQLTRLHLTEAAISGQLADLYPSRISPNWPALI
jgi:hypothetical protein